MKLAFIGDIHGEDYWKKVNINKYDKVVFTGDYVDSAYLSNENIISNLEEILALKKSNSDKVHLIVGNHDVMYMFYPEQQCSGFRESYQKELTSIFNTNIDLFQLAWEYKNILATHAGVDSWWYENIFTIDNNLSLGENLNKSFQKRRKSLFIIGRMRGGSEYSGGPLWADSGEIKNNFPCKDLKGIHQIVGHTPVKDIEIHNFDKNTKIIFIDTHLYKRGSYYELEI